MEIHLTESETNTLRWLMEQRLDEIFPSAFGAIMDVFDMRKNWASIHEKLRGGNGASRVDMEGQKIGRWKVLRRAQRERDREYALRSSWRPGTAWLCECECGTKRVVPGARLRNGTSKSCGCLFNATKVAK